MYRFLSISPYCPVVYSGTTIVAVLPLTVTQNLKREQATNHQIWYAYVRGAVLLNLDFGDIDVDLIYKNQFYRFLCHNNNFGMKQAAAVITKFGKQKSQTHIVQSLDP